MRLNTERALNPEKASSNRRPPNPMSRRRRVCLPVDLGASVTLRHRKAINELIPGYIVGPHRLLYIGTSRLHFPPALALAPIHPALTQRSTTARDCNALALNREPSEPAGVDGRWWQSPGTRWSPWPTPSGH